MPTDPAGLVSQLEGARGTKLDPVILVRVRRSCTWATAKATKPMNVATITRISDFHRLGEGTVMSQSRRSRIGFRGGIADE